MSERVIATVLNGAVEALKSEFSDNPTIGNLRTRWISDLANEIESPPEGKIFIADYFKKRLSADLYNPDPDGTTFDMDLDSTVGRASRAAIDCAAELIEMLGESTPSERSRKEIIRICQNIVLGYMYS